MEKVSRIQDLRVLANDLEKKVSDKAAFLDSAQAKAVSQYVSEQEKAILEARKAFEQSKKELEETLVQVVQTVDERASDRLAAAYGAFGVEVC